MESLYYHLGFRDLVLVLPQSLCVARCATRRNLAVEARISFDVR
jgi:hypothetical protein